MSSSANRSIPARAHRNAAKDTGWIASQVCTSESILLRRYRGWRPSPHRQDGSLVATALRSAAGRSSSRLPRLAGRGPLFMRCAGLPNDRRLQTMTTPTAQRSNFGERK